MKPGRLCLWVAVLLAGFLPAAFGQSTNAGDISGTVTDTSGAVIPDATVSIVNLATGVAHNYTTNAAGIYDTSSIVAGNYKITFSKAGFTSVVHSSITVNVGQLQLNAQLAVGTVSTQVVVNTDVPLVNTENGAVTSTMEYETLNRLPQVSSIGQDWSSFNILQAGAAGAPGGNQGVVGSGTSNGTMLSFNGNLPFSTVLADGAETTLPASANSDITVQEDIQEVQTSSSAFSAQYGVGGILYNQISKGGGDRFHGSAYEYFQNTDLNANNYTFGSTATKPQIHFHEFGGTIGGPIIRQKLFFFFNYDHIIDNGGNAAAFYTTPTQAELSGNFAGLPTIYDPATTTVFQQTGTYTYPGASTPTACPCITRQPFPNNQIPADRFDAVAANLQKYFPAPNTAGTISNGQVQNNYTYTPPNINPFTKFFGRLDYNLTSTNKLNGSVTEGNNPGKSFGWGDCPIDCQSGDVSRINSQVTDVWSINSHITNEARLGYTNQLNFFVPYTLNKGYPAKLGWQFAKADNFPIITITNFNFSGSNPNSSLLTSNINAVYKEHAYAPSDVVTMIIGKHVLHFGGEFLIYQNNSTAWGNVNAGQMTYTGNYTQAYIGDSSTGVGYADFLLGQTQNWNATVTPEYGGREKLPQLFVQDDYKVTPSLTLNLGLRYQIQTGWSEVKGNEASFDPTITNPVTNTGGAIWFGSTHVNGRTHLQKPVYTTFLPRVGFAYQLNSKTTINGGFGLFAYNWSNDQYGGGMGQAFGSKGSVNDNTNGLTPVVTLSGSGSSLPFVANSTAPGAYNGQSFNYNAYHEPVGGSYQWNLRAQRQIGTNVVASLGYVATHGHNLPWPVDINQVPENLLSANDQGSRPYPQFGSLNTSGTPDSVNAISNYNSLQAVIEKRMSQGLSLQFSYVWSHFLDDADSAGWGSHSGATQIQNSFVPSANYGNSNFDIRNAFRGYGVYALPFGRGRQFLSNSTLLDTLIGGWQLAGTLILQDGQPYTPQLSSGTNSYSLAGNNFSWFPNIIGSPSLQHRSTQQWFNEAAFAVPAPGTFGDARRNQLTGPGFERINFGLGKTFHFTEGVNVEVRADANNAFNHPTFGLPNNNLTVCPASGVLPSGCGGYGAISTGTSTITSITQNGRNLQLSAHLTF
ncbi:MAG TPA: carboxypeptidase-like regulatory domain-containing protein [Acidobacteriaceae bacterium]|nr:carboxypeptidase-like regulatory domain-containing protein [Acidobacteriaceae bacterium]